MLNISIEDSVTIRAGAGAGKTTQMVAHVLRILRENRSQGRAWPRIVVTTFTRKATQELRERILVEALKVQDPELIRYIQRSSGLHISTIHGLLMKYLSLFGERLGLPPRLSFLSDSDTSQWKRRILKKVLAQSEDGVAQDVNALLEECDWRQLWKAVEVWQEARVASAEPFEPLTSAQLIAAREGQVQEVLRRGQEFLQRIALEDRSPSLSKTEEIIRGSIHGADLRGLQSLAERIGRKPSMPKSASASLIEARDKFFELLKEVNDWSWSDEFIAQFSELNGSFSRAAQALGGEIQSMKFQKGLITSNDLETISLQLLREFPESAGAFGADWNYWMVDEFQDTSPRQVQLIEALSEGKPIFCVGDPQQSIYLFRGARTEVFQNLLLRTEEKKGQKRELMRNWRSRPELLHFINQFFSDFNPHFASMEAGQKASAEAYHPVVYWRNTDMEKNFDSAAAVVRVQELIQQGVVPSEICILMSTNLMMDQMAQALNESGVIYQRVSGQDFYSHREIRDAGALLRFCLNPHDNVNLVGLLRAHYFEMTDEELVGLSRDIRDSLWLTLLKEASTHSDVIRLLEYWKASQSVGVSNAWEAMLIKLGFFHESYSIDPSGERESRLWQFVTMVKAQEGAPGFSYLSFLTKLEEGDEEFQQSLSEMPPARVSDRVQMMTVHASKGLEFEHVILPFLGKRPRGGRTTPLLLNEDSREWSWSVLDPEGARCHPRLTEAWTESRKLQELEEKDRLLYVAMTRAKVGLSLIVGEIEKGSWAERFPAFSSEAYSQFVQVREGVPEFSMLVNERSQNVLARPLWSESLALQTASVSVTQLLPSHDGGSPPPMTLIEASLKGNEIHRELESWKYLPREQWAKSSWYSVLRDFRDGLVLSVVDTGEVESGFIATLDGRIFQGKIDLWGRDAAGQVWIIDYKSGSAQSFEKSFLQLEYYSLALRLMGKIGRDEVVQCLPLYLFDLGASRAGVARSYDVLLAEVRERLKA